MTRRLDTESQIQANVFKKIFSSGQEDKDSTDDTVT